MSTHNITIAGTNNTSIVKFVSNQQVTNGGSYQFNNIDEAKESPISQQLFKLPFVSKVFISANFIAIEKYDIVEWSDIQNDIRELIEIYLNEGNTIVTDKAETRKVAVEIYAESTPNPMVMKFGCNKMLTPDDHEYKSSSETKNSPLAQVLFEFPFVKEVYISENYVSITKNELIEWGEINLQLRTFLREYIQSGKLIIDTTIEKPKVEIETTPIENLEGTPLEIANILEEYVKPAVANDGGNIVFQSYDATTQDVHVILQGACSGCPSSTMTLKNGIETMLKEMLPNKINNVIAVNG
ncbi:NifU family protein [Wenyingzhuangia sp. 2_MG-2023]|uniref:NifU family protein n=1 Tax=Wenyingzhuangia sp. 2_MG-2023 TaxID=3062639 RepID=UPI0026E26392|nr:NifU family protein [Wenyingzhuangia sp. 2_MG-2023]MDO6737558.1 NifU family protein [Wenyingzhuangia sp. 2_MG-2023]MDO6802394.1 NifU family protein [Wenyingzhuangia sp. 1_MG-2023]